MDQTTQRAQRRADFSKNHFRTRVDESIHRGDANPCNRVRMFIRSITDRYVNTDHEIAIFEVDIHDLWYLVIEAAKATPTKDALADQLASQVLIAREFGPLCRPGEPPAPHSTDSKGKTLEVGQRAQVEFAVTSSSARMWIDLPFLVSDLRDTWIGSVGTMAVTERENLAGFTARLTALGICHPQLTSCALVLFREALETPRRVVETDELEAGTGQANESPLSDFLPAVVAWLRHGSYKILTLCAQGYLPLGEDNSVEKGERWDRVGPLLAGSKGKHEPGFHMARWQFWKDRLLEVEQTAGDKTVAEQGRMCAYMMESWDLITGGRSHDRVFARQADFGMEERRWSKMRRKLYLKK